MRILVALLVVPLVAATVMVPGPREGMWHDPDGGYTDSIQSLQWRVDQNGSHVEWIGEPPELRVMLLGGSRSASTAEDWVLIHIGNQTRVYDATGPIEFQALNRSSVDFRPVLGSCVYAVGEVLAWDHGYTVTDAVPDGSTLDWNGDLCDGNFLPEPVAKETKKSPLPVVWAFVALVLARRVPPP